MGEEQTAFGSFLSVRGKFQTAKLAWNWPILEAGGEVVVNTAFWLNAPRLAAALGVQVRPGGAPNSGEMFGYTL